jgi:hypothetical protein
MSARRPPATLALVAWTVLVWTTRINNILTDDALGGGDKALRVALALSFTALAALVVWAWTKRATWLRQAVLALAVWTVGVWVVRAVGIAFADHDAAFIAVHLVLAVVSTVLAALAVREHGAARLSDAEPAARPR